jgi:hypothetical protein
MRWLFLGLVVTLGATSVQAADPKPQKPLFGWFIELPDAGITYALMPQAPEVNKDKKDEIYRQSFKYVWTGNDLRMITVTLARDPEFKTKFTAEGVKKDYPGAVKAEVGKKTGWIIPLGKEPLPQGPVKLILPLGEDKAVLVETEGSPRENDVLDFAGKLDLAAIETALSKPPRTDFSAKVELFAGLKKGMSELKIGLYVGDCDVYDGSQPKAPVLEYKLADGSRVKLAIEGGKLKSATHEKDGKTEELLK